MAQWEMDTELGRGAWDSIGVVVFVETWTNYGKDPTRKAKKV